MPESERNSATGVRTPFLRFHSSHELPFYDSTRTPTYLVGVQFMFETIFHGDEIDFSSLSKLMETYIYIYIYIYWAKERERERERERGGEGAKVDIE